MYLKSWCKHKQRMSLCWSTVYIPVLVAWYTKFKSQQKESVHERRSDPFGKNHSNIWYLCVLPFYFLISSHSGVRWTSLLSFHNQVGAFPFCGCCVPLENSPARQKGSQDGGRAGGSPPGRKLDIFFSVKMIDDLWISKKVVAEASFSETATVNVWLVLSWLAEVSLTVAGCRDSQPCRDELFLNSSSDVWGTNRAFQSFVRHQEKLV